MAIEADYYFAAGDLVNWARGLEPCGKILQPAASKVYVLPGNHESAPQIAAFCAQFGFHNFHEQTHSHRQTSRGRPRLLESHAIRYSRASTAKPSWPNAWRVSITWIRWY